MQIIDSIVGYTTTSGDLHRMATLGKVSLK